MWPVIYFPVALFTAFAFLVYVKIWLVGRIEGDDIFASLIVGAFWPVAVPIVCCFFLFHYGAGFVDGLLERLLVKFYDN